MAPQTQSRGSVRGGATRRSHTQTIPKENTFRTDPSRIQKPGRGRARGVMEYRKGPRSFSEANPTSRSTEARDGTSPLITRTRTILHGPRRNLPSPSTEARHTTPSLVTRTPTPLHGCSDASLLFTTLANLPTTPDTNTITLNLMDHFLFSSANWLPELSYCALHAATFYFVSLLTGLAENTAERVAEALGPESGFVRALVDETNVFDSEEGKSVVRGVIGVGVEDVRVCYGILYERKEELVGLVGEFADGVRRLPEPESMALHGEEEAVGVEEEDLDVFEG